MSALWQPVQLIGAALLLGAIAFTALVWRPALSGETEAAALDSRLLAWMRRAALAGALLLVAAAPAGMLGLAAQLSPAPRFSPVTLALAADLLITSDAGRMTLVRVIAAVGLVVVSTLLRPGRRQSWFGLTLGLLLLVTFSLTGHAAASPAAAAADLVHLAATMLWFGGLCYLALLCWISLTQEETGSLVRSVHRFSNLGLIAMVLLALTGVYMAALRLYGLRAMVEHPYGQTLAIKLAFLGGVLLLAGLNRFAIRPRLGREGQTARVMGCLRWAVTGEALLGLAVLVAGGLLGTTAPPEGEPFRLAVSVRDGRILPAELAAPQGQPLRLTVVNHGPSVCTLVVPGIPHAMTGGHDHHAHEADMYITVRPRRSDLLQFTPGRAGSYEVYCLTTGPPEESMTALLHIR